MIFRLEDKLLSWVRKNWLALCGAALLVLSIAQRYRVMSYYSDDMIACLIPWFEQIKKGGKWASLSGLIGNYNMAYQTLLTLLTYLPGEYIFLIKIPSLVCDGNMAFFGALAVKNACRSTPPRKMPI